MTDGNPYLMDERIAIQAIARDFGRPIGSFQAIRFKLAGKAIDEEAAMVKLFATEMAERVTGEAIQVHGGNGHPTECAVERYWGDARVTTIFEGPSEIQRVVVSDRLLGRTR